MDAAAASFLTYAGEELQQRSAAYIPYGPDRVVPMGGKFAIRAQSYGGQEESQRDPGRPHLKDVVESSGQTSGILKQGGIFRMGVGNVPILDQVVATYRRAKTKQMMIGGSEGPVPIWKVLEFGTRGRMTGLRAESSEAPRMLTIHKNGQIGLRPGPVSSGQIKGPPIANSPAPPIMKYPFNVGLAPFRRAASDWLQGAVQRFKMTAGYFHATERTYGGGK